MSRNAQTSRSAPAFYFTLGCLAAILLAVASSYATLRKLDPNPHNEAVVSGLFMLLIAMTGLCSVLAFAKGFTALRRLEQPDA